MLSRDWASRCKKGSNVSLYLFFFQTNAIVNSVASNLNLSSGALSNSIMAAMSGASRKAVQAEAHAYQNKGLRAGDVFSTGPGDLACKKIFHIILTQWKNEPTTIKVNIHGQ